MSSQYESPHDLCIRPEAPADVRTIHALNAAAFETPMEAQLVDALRTAEPSPFISLVAERSGEIIGHILFTPATVETEADLWRALALGPMAVHPDHQRCGIGSALVRHGLEVCRSQEHDIVFVLGHPDYYPRFGFRAAPPLGFRCRWPVPGEAFMVRDVGHYPMTEGFVRYHEIFETLA